MFGSLRAFGGLVSRTMLNQGLAAGGRVPGAAQRPCAAAFWPSLSGVAGGFSRSLTTLGRPTASLPSTTVGSTLVARSNSLLGSFLPAFSPFGLIARLSSTVKKRRSKMNKHKLKKRRKKMRNRTGKNL